MKPFSISLMGFKCFGQRTSFEFPQKPGLYLVSGRNEVQPELEGNGCGKSTLFTDAVTWLFFGKTPRLLKASDIVHWETSSSSVDFVFEHGGRKIRVIRTQSPNSLSWALGEDALQTVSQDQLLDFLDIDFDSFISSVVFGQFTSMFFDLSPADKSTLLSNILNLDIWDNASDLAKAKCQLLHKDFSASTQEVSHLCGQILALEEMDFSAKITEWDAKQREQKNLLLEQKENNENQLKILAVNGAAYKKVLDEFNESLQGVLELKSEVTTEILLFDKEINQLQRDVSGLNSNLTMVEKELGKFEKVSGTCPYCLQVVSEDHLNKELLRIKQTIASILKEIKAVKDKIAAVQESKEVSTDSLIEIQAAEKEIKLDISDVTEKINQLKVSVMGIKKDLSSTEQRLATLSSTTNPYLFEEQQVQEKIQNFRSTLAKLKQAISTLEQEELDTNYWVKGFRDVRLMLISDVLTQLELEVNNHLYSLGLQEWKVNFAVDGLTKGGKIKKGFTVTITTPVISEPVPWAAWSGGETQRLRLAGALGMADLISSKNKFNSSIEILDEPSQYMSNQGISSLIQVLQDRARTLNKTIFLIDHRYLDSQSFDGNFTVVKTLEAVFVV